MLPLDEYFQTYDGVWLDGVDRWYGQQMSQQQIERIRGYYWDTAELERPVWAKALWWYCTGAHPEIYRDCGWDFGLWSDLQAVVWRRKVQDWRPFRWSESLWERMAERRSCLDLRIQRSRINDRLNSAEDWRAFRRRIVDEEFYV